GYAIGLALSAIADLPSGAVIVWTLAACALGASAALRPRPARRGPVEAGLPQPGTPGHPVDAAD
ncbi:MAG: hypothetical protein KF683_19975, partial [Rubrivivax sp.]|nr:hypothetical protein [Rubrivivax sp.]